jgi:hypothetical protein
MLATGVEKALPHWDIGATSSELDEPLEMSHLAGKLSSAVGHEGPLTFTDDTPFNCLAIEQTRQKPLFSSRICPSLFGRIESGWLVQGLLQIPA